MANRCRKGGQHLVRNKPHQGSVLTFEKARCSLHGWRTRQQYTTLHVSWKPLDKWIQDSLQFIRARQTDQTAGLQAGSLKRDADIPISRGCQN